MRHIMTWFIVLVLTIFFGSISLISSIFDRKGNVGAWCMRKWARGILKSAGVKFQCLGFDKIDKNCNYLFLPNHQSQVDIIVLSAVIPVKFAWMAKKSLFSIPFLGWHMKNMGYVPIDRKSISSGTRGLKMAVTKLSNGGSMVIFPEGSRSKDGKLKSFKDGAFFLACESKTPIVPITINGTSTLMKKGSWKICSSEIKIIAADVIEVEKYSHLERDGLKEMVRDKIQCNLEY